MTRARQSVAGAFQRESDALTQIERADAACARFSLLERMFVERGTKRDWELLHELHYKAENLPSGPRFWRLDLEGETVGVLVTATPKGLLKERHLAFPHLKPDGQDTRLTNTHRYKWINANMRVISRFVVDTMYRGVGAGYRFMNLVSRIEGAPIMEIQSSMSKFNLFGQKAGFRFVRPLNANKYVQGLTFLRSTFAAHPADLEAILAELAGLDAARREAVLEEVRAFYYRHSALEKTGSNRGNGQTRVAAMDARTLVKSLQQLVLASPMYGVWKNPDAGRPPPERLPLIAFDAQEPTRPLAWRGDE
ncbi:hypothetical protein [Azospirillum argentinense]|uniref:hypothetical protein n=1 Tax=Azospirillum argentinense TaxID=2970906 RepID=UPI0032E00BC9